MQWRLPVGGGPSSKTWPRWPPQRRQCPSVRVLKKVLSSLNATFPSISAQKLGQPVPDSNFVSEEKTGRSQPAQLNVPLAFTSSSGLVQGRSVPSSRSTAYC